MSEVMTDAETEMYVWRRDRVKVALATLTPDLPQVIAEIVAVGVAADELSPTEFLALVAAGCDPVLALEILKPL